MFYRPRETKKPRVQLKCLDPSRTKQADKNKCDINLIMKKAYAGHQIQHVNKIQGQYGDFSEVNDYSSALNAIILANDAFAGLSSQVRKKFNNDPSQLLNFVENSKNMAEAIKLGLINEDKSKQYLKAQAIKNAPKNDDQTTKKPAKPTA